MGSKFAHDLVHRQPICLNGKFWEADALEDILTRTSDDVYVYVNDNLI